MLGSICERSVASSRFQCSYSHSPFVDLVTVLLAQAPRFAILNSFLLGIVSSSRAINTRRDRVFGPRNLALKKLPGQIWVEFYDFATMDQSEIPFSMIPRYSFYLKVRFTGIINFLVEK